MPAVAPNALSQLDEKVGFCMKTLIFCTRWWFVEHSLQYICNLAPFLIFCPDHDLGWPLNTLDDWLDYPSHYFLYMFSLKKKKQYDDSKQ